MIGSPAPTVVSCNRRRPRASARARSSSYSLRWAVSGRLFASTRCMPAARACFSVSLVSSAVTSTRIGLARACRAAKSSASRAPALRPPGALASGVPDALAAASAASRGADSPRASNTKPLRSTAATTVTARGSRFSFAISAARAQPRCPQPDDAERRAPGAHLHAVDLPPRDLALELLDEARAGALGRRFGNAEADGVLRRRLGDERDRDPLAVDGGEGARRDAGDAQHPVSLHGEQRLPRHRGERLHGIAVERAAP